MYKISSPDGLGAAAERRGAERSTSGVKRVAGTIAIEALVNSYGNCEHARSA